MEGREGGHIIIASTHPSSSLLLGRMLIRLVDPVGKEEAGRVGTYCRFSGFSREDLHSSMSSEQTIEAHAVFSPQNQYPIKGSRRRSKSIRSMSYEEVTSEPVTLTIRMKRVGEVTAEY
jgi:hypothetical protein